VVDLVVIGCSIDFQDLQPCHHFANVSLKLNGCGSLVIVTYRMRSPGTSEAPSSMASQDPGILGGESRFANTWIYETKNCNTADLDPEAFCLPCCRLVTTVNVVQGSAAPGHTVFVSYLLAQR
jgi:hypothetical protein